MDEAQRTRVIRTISEQLGVIETAVTDEKSIVADLGADSLDAIEIVMAMEDEFCILIADDDAEKCVTVADVLALVKRAVVEQAP